MGSLDIGFSSVWQEHPVSLSIHLLLVIDLECGLC